MAPDALHPIVEASLRPFLLWTHYPATPRVQVEGQPCIHCGNPEPQTLHEPCEGCVALNEMIDRHHAQSQEPLT